MARVYLDWNASAPLRPEARDAMLAAMAATGNPSSQHAEGRAARRILDQARAAVAALAGAAPEEVAFTSGATEAINAAMLGPAASGAERFGEIWLAESDHAAMRAAAEAAERAYGARTRFFARGPDGALAADAAPEGALIALTAANSEAGWVERGAIEATAEARPKLLDATQLYGKTAFDAAGPVQLSDLRPETFAVTALSAHKIGGPRGIGALIFREGRGMAAPVFVHGGGQEFRRRSGTENVIGAAGFGAAAEALLRDPPDWAAVAARRDALEARIAAAAPDVVFIRPDPASGAARLANTALFATPGWGADAQLIQMDLAGFAISAGSACASGKIAVSPVVSALGFGEAAAASAIRVSIGPQTPDAALEAFADAWIQARNRAEPKIAAARTAG